MLETLTFAEQILRFNEGLSLESLNLPDGFRVVNPFQGEQREQVRKATRAFYREYYNDTHTRRIILGSTPARRGTAVTGIPFVDAKQLQSETSIYIDNFYINPSSSGFLYDVISKYGGSKKFYSAFYMNFVCPLGIARINSKGNEVNCNYYENKKVQALLYPFILRTLRQQLGFRLDTSVCYCIGSGENYSFLSQLNKEHNFFDSIIPLEHPRFIMQYNSKDKAKYLAKYLDALCGS